MYNYAEDFQSEIHSSSIEYLDVSDYQFFRKIVTSDSRTLYIFGYANYIVPCEYNSSFGKIVPITTYNVSGTGGAVEDITYNATDDFFYVSSQKYILTLSIGTSSVTLESTYTGTTDYNYTYMLYSTYTSRLYAIRRSCECQVFEDNGSGTLSSKGTTSLGTFGVDIIRSMCWQTNGGYFWVGIFEATSYYRAVLLTAGLTGVSVAVSAQDLANIGGFFIVNDIVATKLYYVYSTRVFIYSIDPSTNALTQEQYYTVSGANFVSIALFDEHITFICDGFTLYFVKEVSYYMYNDVRNTQQGIRFLLSDPTNMKIFTFKRAMSGSDYKTYFLQVGLYPLPKNKAIYIQ